MKEKHIYGFQQYETFSDFLVNVFILKKLVLLRLKRSKQSIKNIVEFDNKSRPKIG